MPVLMSIAAHMRFPLRATVMWVPAQELQACKPHLST